MLKMEWTFNAPKGTPTNGPEIATVASIMTGLSLTTVCLRMYVRGWLIKAIGADDWAIIFSWLASCEYAIGTITQTRWGLGLTELNDMPAENIYSFSLIQYIGAPFYVCSLYGFKVSLLLSYLRFVPPGVYQKVTITVSVLITMAHIAFAMVFLFMCRPIAKQWDPSIKDGSCLDGVPFYTSFSSLTIVFDITVMLLPFPVLLKTQMKKRKKFVILGLFALGIFVTGIQIIRFQTIKSLKNYLDSALPIRWSIVECNLGIIVACIPTLAPLIKYFSERSKASHGSASTSRLPSSHALQSFRGGPRLGRQTHITANPYGDSTDQICNMNGIIKETKVTVSSSDRGSSDVA